MSQFILLIRGGNETTEHYSPEAMQQEIERYRQWSQQLAQAGKLVDAFKLKDDGGRIMSVRDQQITVDGPFAETKETIGGYFIITAENYAEATELARGCPIFAQGGTLEVREIEL
jgi:hypothetical protein